MTTLLILSDLHLGFGLMEAEINGKPIDADADIVVLAGDIDEGTAGLSWARVSFPDKHIVYVAGNHEFYEHEWSACLAQLRETAATLGIHFLEKDEAVIDGVRFLGCTLWTDFELAGEYHVTGSIFLANRHSNDYQFIQKKHLSRDGKGRVKEQAPLRAADTRAAHLESRAWLAQQLANGGPAKTVVVTHHAPSRQSVTKASLADLFSSAYASNLDDLMGRSALWVHGHLHNSSDYTVNGTRVVCNPRGYWDRKEGKASNIRFRPDLVVEV